MPLKSRWNISIPDQHLSSLIFTSPTHPLDNEKPLYIDLDNTSISLTLHAYRIWSQRLAAGLVKHGLKSGERVLLFTPNSIAFPIAFQGIIMAGGIYTGANPTYVAREVAHQLKDSGATMLFCAPTSLDTGLEAASSIGFPKSSIFVLDNAPFTGAPGRPQQGCAHWSFLLVSPDEGSKFHWDPCSTPEKSSQTIALNYSSGTTGLPKGVEITHKNYVANALQTDHVIHLEFEGRTPPEDVTLCVLPLYHAYGQTVFMTGTVIRGVPTYIMPKFDFVKFMDAIEKHRLTVVGLVPPIIVAMAKHPDVIRGRWDLSSLREIGSGAAPLSRETCDQLEAIIRKQGGHASIKQGWGMTELASLSSSSDLNNIYMTAIYTKTCKMLTYIIHHRITCTGLSPDTRTKQKDSNVGVLPANCEARIMNEDGTAEVPPCERGELWIRAPNVMKGYWRNPEATRKTLTADGWLKTGDVCYVDEGQNFFIVDRKKELIKVKGNQVAPAELEALLLEHPQVGDAAVIGVPNGEDEQPLGYVVVKGSMTGSEALVADIHAFVRERAHRTKQLTGGILFLDVIPKSPSGKILRKELRERAAKERAARPRL